MSDEAPSIPEPDLADRMSLALKHARMGPAEMAEYLEVARGTLRNWLAGRITPSAQTTRLWAMRCGVPYEWLAHGITAGEAPPPRSNHRFRHLELQPEPEITTQEILAHQKQVDALRTQLHGPRRDSTDRRREATL